MLRGLVFCMVSLLFYLSPVLGGKKTVISATTGISFTVLSAWKVTDLKKEMVDDDDPEFKMKTHGFFEDFDMYECLSPSEDSPERGFVVFLFKDGALNALELRYNGLSFQQEGTGGVMECGKSKITRILMDNVPDSFIGMQVEQFTFSFKKKNVLIYYWKDPEGMPADEVDEEMVRILCSFHLN